MTRLRRAVALVVALLTLPAAAQAQAAPGKVWRLGVLMSFYSPDDEPPQALRQALRELGYVEGQNLVIEWRYAGGRDERMPSLAAELVRLNVDVIVSDITTTTRAAMQATSRIPIVMAFGADPVGGGIVTNLARPGGNVTGNSIMLAEVSVKRLQLLKEAIPKVSRVAILWNPGTPFHKAMLTEINAAAPSLRLQSLAVAVKDRSDFGSALAEITRQRADAVFVSHVLSVSAARELLEFAARHRLPTMFAYRDYVPTGGLMSYAPNRVEMFRRAAAYVDKIFRGAKPGDLPVEQPTKFDLVVNLKSAKALGITIAPSVLAQAAEVIQ